VVAIVSIADGGLDDGCRRNAKSEDTFDTLSAQQRLGGLMDGIAGTLLASIAKLPKILLAKPLDQNPKGHNSQSSIGSLKFRSA
jgi:hypothetical protein